MFTKSPYYKLALMFLIAGFVCIIPFLSMVYLIFPFYEVFSNVWIHSLLAIVTLGAAIVFIRNLKVSNIVKGISAITLTLMLLFSVLVTWFTYSFHKTANFKNISACNEFRILASEVSEFQRTQDSQIYPQKGKRIGSLKDKESTYDGEIYLQKGLTYKWIGDLKIKDGMIYYDDIRNLEKNEKTKVIECINKSYLEL